MADLLIAGGTVVDATGSRRADVALSGGLIAAVEERIEPRAGDTVLDASGCYVAPGLVDIHTHLREPGNEDAETVMTGARAAALGGYTAVVAMPNTDPPIDSAPLVGHVLALGRNAPCRVAVAGAITVGRSGERLAPLAEMAAAGARFFTDDGAGVQDAGLMRRAMEYSRGLGLLLAEHCEEASLHAGGHMHEGSWSGRLGVGGIPAAAEEVMVARDIALARLTGARIHFLHLSTAGSVALVEQAKAEGLPVTAEVAPHHLVLCDAALGGYDTVFKVNPPLRSASDVEALRAACARGSVDAVATDHAPHPPQAKDVPLDQAAAGMLGLETALGIVLRVLWDGYGGADGDSPGEVPVAARRSRRSRSSTAGALVGASAPSLGIADVLGLMSWRPARIAGLATDQGGDQGGPVAAGMPGNLCVIDPSIAWEVDPSRLASLSRNTPYARWRFVGRARHTVSAGRAVVIDGEAQC